MVASSPCSSSVIARASATGSSADDLAALEERARRRAHAPEHVLDHAVEPELQAVVRRVDLFDPVGLEFLELVRRDRAAAAHDHADVGRAVCLQQVHHVAEILVVPTLVAADGDPVGVLLDRGPHDVGNAAVVAKVHDLGAVRLQDAADDIDGRVMTVE